MKASWTGLIRIGDMSLPLSIAPASGEPSEGLNLVCADHVCGVRQMYVCASAGDDGGHEVTEPARGVVEPKSGWTRIVQTDELDSLKELGDKEIIITETHSQWDFDAAQIEQGYRCWTEPAFESVYASLWRAMDRAQMVACGTMVTAQKRKWPIAFRPTAQSGGGKAFSLYKLRWYEDMRPMVTLTNEQAKPDVVKLWGELLDTMKSNRPVLESEVNTYLEGLRALLRNQELIRRVG